MAKRKILIPLDGSDFSRQIVNVVRTFFAPQDVCLVLFRVVHPPAITSELPTHETYINTTAMPGGYETYSKALDVEFAAATKERETLRAEILSDMRKDAQQLEKVGYTVTVEVRFGDPAQRIENYVQQEEIDLVAMTTHGRTGIGRLVLGSVAEHVMRAVSVPVLLMRNKELSAPQHSPGEELAQALGGDRKLSITTATDGSTLAQQGVKAAAETAKLLDASLTVLVVAGPNDPLESSHKLMARVHTVLDEIPPKSKPAKPKIVPLVGYPDDVILQQIKKAPTDILMIGPHRDRGASSTTAIGPTAHRLVQYAPVSTWMVKGRRLVPRRILAAVAVDDTVVVDVAAQLARAFDAELNVLHVVPPTAATYLASGGGAPLKTDEPVATLLDVQEALAQKTHLATVLQEWSRLLERSGISQESLILQHGSVTETILRRAHDGGYDLIVTGSQSGPGRFLGSVANSVVRYAEQPVLVVRTQPH